MKKAEIFVKGYHAGTLTEIEKGKEYTFEYVEGYKGYDVSLTMPGTNRIYKFESFELFQQMINKVNRDITSFLVKAYLPQENQQQVREVQAPRPEPAQRYQTNRTDDPSLGSGSNNNNAGNQPNPEQERPKLQPIRVEKTVGRNDPCPCGSGKKFKQCHGAS